MAIDQTLAAAKANDDESKSRLDALLTYANGVTGQTDSSIGDAIKTLSAGYGRGGSEPTVLKTVDFGGSNRPNSVYLNVDDYPGYTFYFADIQAEASSSDWLYINDKYASQSKIANYFAPLALNVGGIMYRTTTVISFSEMPDSMRNIRIHWYSSGTVFTSGKITFFGV